MSISLHTAVVGTFQQILPQVLRLIDKAEAHCRDAGLPDSALSEICLAPDMWPFAKQVHECAHHSVGAIEAVRSGAFSPDPDPVPPDFATMRRVIEEAMATVNAVDPGELDAIAGRDMEFKAGPFNMMFTVSDFLMSFTLPNFYFHSAAAYNLLRMQGLAIGKRDFLGVMRSRNLN